MLSIKSSMPMSIPRSGNLALPPLPPPRHLTDRGNNGGFAALSSAKTTAGTATLIRSIHTKNHSSRNGAVERATPNHNAPQDSTEVYLECKGKIQVSYTISEDMSGNCKKNILSRISKKKRDSRDVRLRIGSPYADRWSLRDRRDPVGGNSGGAALSNSVSPYATSHRDSPEYEYVLPMASKQNPEAENQQIKYLQVPDEYLQVPDDHRFVAALNQRVGRNRGDASINRSPYHNRSEDLVMADSPSRRRSISYAPDVPRIDRSRVNSYGQQSPAIVTPGIDAEAFASRVASATRAAIAQPAAQYSAPLAPRMISNIERAVNDDARLREERLEDSEEIMRRDAIIREVVAREGLARGSMARNSRPYERDLRRNVGRRY